MTELQRQILIVGAGPTGLGAAWRLHELAVRQRISPAIDWLLADKAAVPGGMATSVTDPRGFTWDLGGHVVYSHYAYFDALLEELLGDDLLQHPRKGWVRMAGRFIPFPIQHNLHYLPDDDVARCLKDLVEARSAVNGHVPANFAEWLQAHFGSALCELFFHPYNLKMWGYPPSVLSTQWTQRKSGSRYANVPLVDLERLLENVVCRRDDPGWQGATPFPYPRNGGMGELWRRTFARLPAENTALSQRLVAIDPANRIARFDGGLRVHYRHLLSSVPLPDLLAVLSVDADAPWPNSPLRYSRTHLAGFGIRGTLPEALRDKFWIHIPDPVVPFFRVSVTSSFSAGNVPDDGPHWSLMCETSEAAETPLDQDTLLAAVECSLRQEGFVPADQPIVARWHRRLDYGYPVPCLARDGFLQQVEPRLRRLGIRSRGRFGGWKYETSNQDNGFMQGVEAIDAMLFGTEEISYFYPDLISEGAVMRLLPD